MTNSQFAKELSQYPLTAIACGLLDFEQLKKQLDKTHGRAFATNPLKLPEEERRKLFGERIKMIRKLRGLNRTELAKQLGVSRPLIAAYETGAREPSLKNLIALIQILGIDPNWLLGLSPHLTELQPAE